METMKLREDLNSRPWESGTADEYVRATYGMIFGGLPHEERVRLAGSLYADGFAANVVAAVLDISAPTARRYVDEAEVGEPQLLTGLDGHNRGNPRAHRLASGVSTLRGQTPHPGHRAVLLDLDKAIYRLEHREAELTPEQMGELAPRLARLAQYLRK